MTMLVDAPSSTAAVSFDLRCATPAPPINRPDRIVAPSIARRTDPQLTSATDASAEIPIASDARPQHISRGFLAWRFADAGPAVHAAPPSWGRHPQTFTISDLELNAGLREAFRRVPAD
jgi:hypothetical protein